MKPETIKTLAAIPEMRRRCEAGSRKPWQDRPNDGDDWGFVRDADGTLVCDTAMSCHYKHEDCGKPEGPSPIPENRAFIAAASRDLPATIAALDDVLGLLRRIVEARDEYDAALKAEMEVVMADGKRPRLHENEAYRSHVAETAKRAAIDEAAELLKGLEPTHPNMEKAQAILATGDFDGALDAIKRTTTEETTP